MKRELGVGRVRSWVVDKSQHGYKNIFTLHKNKFRVQNNKFSEKETLRLFYF